MTNPTPSSEPVDGEPILNTPNSGELKSMIFTYLKKAYFNARTDVVGEHNGLLPKGSAHAQGVLENMTDDLAKLLDLCHNRQIAALLEDLLEEYNEFMVNDGEADLLAIPASVITERLEQYEDRA